MLADKIVDIWKNVKPDPKIYRETQETYKKEMVEVFSDSVRILEDFLENIEES